MKTITLTDGENKYQVNIVYSIFDIRESMYTENYEVASANNSQHALQFYNKAKNKTDKYKRTDGYGRDAEICVSSQFYDKHGTRYKYGKRIWFKIV